MLVKVRTGKLVLAIPIPNWLLLNPFCTSLVLRKVDEVETAMPVISKSQLQLLGKCIHDLKREHGSITLVEVEAADGTYVEIKL